MKNEPPNENRKVSALAFCSLMAALGAALMLMGGFIPVMVPDLMQPEEDVRGLYARRCESLLEVRDLLAAGELG